MKGLFAWVGFKSTSVVYDRDPRFAGTTKWNYWRLWNFALEGITSFVVCRTILFGREVAGYASLMVAILFLASVQLIVLGVIGEYVSRIFVESKGRPLYLIHRYVPPGSDRSLSLAKGPADSSPGKVSRDS